jgi:quinolinate synthase
MEKEKVKDQITDLKIRNKAIILAHNYQIPDIQDIADFVGDSLDLAIKAKKTNSKNIIFCGVDFMAESAKIINPEKNVIHPDFKAKCPMAGMVNKESLILLKDKYPKAQIVSYINTNSDVKSISDVCCTSSNGIKIIKNISSKDIIFVPDKNLGLFIQRSIKNKNMILWPGICPTHNNIKKNEILELKKNHPKAEILVHPECRPEIIDIADKVFSTNGMINYVSKSDVLEFIIGTEKDICYRLKKENPYKIFYPVESAICPNMKKITIEKVLNSLATLEPKIKIKSDILKKARVPLEKMMKIGRGD